MAEKRFFLNRTYAAYHNRAVPEPDGELVRVGPGTPAGEYLRRFWQPVAHSHDLGDMPLAIRIMGEDLVVFRDGRGEIGLLQRHCSHRGTSLEYGKIEPRGLRCCYHGWLYDTDGTILETPAEPAHSKLKDRLCHGAYPVHEYEGLVFAYMGPPETMVPFPVLDTFELEGYVLGPGEPLGLANVKPCNWLQVMDNVPDLVHEAFLHARHSGVQFLDEDGRPVEELKDVGETDYIETPNGMIVQETRRVKADVWCRTIEYIIPNIAQIPMTPAFPPKYKDGEDTLCYLSFVTRWRVPMDDENTLEFAFVRLRPDQENRYVTDPGPVVRSNYGGRPYEERQRWPGDFEAQVGQRPIARHALEHLGHTDRGVSMMRKMLREGIRAVAGGQDPRGLHRNLDGPIPTYGNDTVMRVAPAPTAHADAALLRRLMRACADDALARPPRRPPRHPGRIAGQRGRLTPRVPRDGRDAKLNRPARKPPRRDRGGQPQREVARGPDRGRR